MSARFAVMGLLLVAVAVAARDVLEATMQRHMLIHIPICIVAGISLGVAFSASRGGPNERVSASTWNAYGVAGLLLASAIVATWMIPRALDAATESVRVDALKVMMLLVAGGVAQQSWRIAPAPVRAFAAGNMAWMSATVGMLLLDAPVRLCTSYASSDQADTGRAMITATVIVIVAAAVRLLMPAPTNTPATRAATSPTVSS